MSKPCLFIGFSFLCLITANAQSLKDSTQKRIVDRIASAISNKCVLNDSAKRELSKCLYWHYIELNKLKNYQKFEQNCFNNDTAESKKAFLIELEQRFGNKVCDAYKKLIEQYTLEGRRQLQLKRNTHPIAEKLIKDSKQYHR